MRGRRLLPLAIVAGVLGACAGSACAQSPAKPASARARLPGPAVQPGPALPANAITSAITLADLGFINGFRFANLAGKQDVFVPLPQGVDIGAATLSLTIDDVSAHEARRSLEILLNDRSVSAIALDGRGSERSIEISLGNAKPRDGFLKLSFQYSGAATPDRCIDVRYVGDSVTVRPGTAITFAIVFPGAPDVATTAALMPRDVAILVPRRKLTGGDMAAALTVARAMAASGRRATFHQGFEQVAELTKRIDQRAWSRGIILVGTLEEAAPFLDTPMAALAGPTPSFGAIVAARVSGLPALVVSDATAVRASQLMGHPTVAATRGVTAATVGTVASPALPTAQITFDQLGITPAQADVYGRANLPVQIDTRILPPNTRMARLLLDVMVAPDGGGEKAVVSVFVNDRLLGSSVAAVGEPTKLDLPLPTGLVGTLADVSALVERRSAQGDCKFEPQGYPAQILGSSTLLLDAAPTLAADFSDLVPRWANGVEVWMQGAVSDDAPSALGLAADLLNALAPETAPIAVKLAPGGTPPYPTGPFLALGDLPPQGPNPRVRFDRGRIAVADRTGKVLLDLGGFSSGAVAQIMNAGDQTGLWVHPLAASGTLPVPPAVKLDRGDVAFVDQTGVAFAMSTERDTLVRLTYPDQVSWVTVADRFRSWIIGSLWLAGTVLFVFLLQRWWRRRPSTSE